MQCSNRCHIANIIVVLLRPHVHAWPHNRLCGRQLRLAVRHMSMVKAMPKSRQAFGKAFAGWRATRPGSVHHEGFL